MTWGIDFTSRVRADLVGLEEAVSEELADVLMAWAENGPPRDHPRQLAGAEVFEAPVGDRHLLGYQVREAPPGVLLLWLRARPGTLGWLAPPARAGRNVAEDRSLERSPPKTRVDPDPQRAALALISSKWA